MYRVLAVDDEEEVLATVEKTLKKYEFEVDCARNAEEARDKMRACDPDIVVLDILLPGTSGKDVFRELQRTHPGLPVIFLSGLDGDYDRVVGLELGADDYLTKPYHPAELLARVRAVLRRTSGPPNDDPAEPPHGPNGAPNGAAKNLVHGPFTLDLENEFDAFVDGEPAGLTKTEFELLRTMLRCPGRTYSRDELKEGAYGVGTYVSDKTINTHINETRKKLKALGVRPIETVRGRGYRVLPAEEL